MSKGVVIALALGVLVVGGFAFWTYKKKNETPSTANSRPPVYTGGGPSAYNPNGPPIATGKVGQASQDINSAVQGGVAFVTSAKKAWDDVSGLFK